MARGGRGVILGPGFFQSNRLGLMSSHWLLLSPEPSHGNTLRALPPGPPAAAHPACEVTPHPAQEEPRRGTEKSAAVWWNRLGRSGQRGAQRARQERDQGARRDQGINATTPSLSTTECPTERPAAPPGHTRAATAPQRAPDSARPHKGATSSLRAAHSAQSHRGAPCPPPAVGPLVEPRAARARPLEAKKEPPPTFRLAAALWSSTYAAGFLRGRRAARWLREA